MQQTTYHISTRHGCTRVGDYQCRVVDAVIGTLVNVTTCLYYSTVCRDATKLIFGLPIEGMLEKREIEL